MLRKLLIPSLIIMGLIAVCLIGVVGIGLVNWLWWSDGETAKMEVARSRILPPLPLPGEPTATPTPIPLDSAAPSVDAPGDLPSEATLPTETPPVFTEAPPPVPPLATATQTTQSSNVSNELILPAGSVSKKSQQGVGTKLVISKLNVDAPITLAPIENGTWNVKHLGGNLVGHLEGTAAAGSDSNMVLAAHVTVSKGVYGPFAGLSLLQPGDEIVVYENSKRFRYLVDYYQVVDRASVEVTYPTDEPELTLITCSRWSSEENRYLDRLVVKGRLVN